MGRFMREGRRESFNRDCDDHGSRSGQAGNKVDRSDRGGRKWVFPRELEEPDLDASLCGAGILPFPCRTTVRTFVAFPPIPRILLVNHRYAVNGFAIEVDHIFTNRRRGGFDTPGRGMEEMKPMARDSNRNANDRRRIGQSGDLLRTGGGELYHATKIKEGPLDGLETLR